MFKRGDKVVFTQHVINLMKKSRGGSRKIFDNDYTLADKMYREGMEKEYMVIEEAKGRVSKMKNMETGEYNWDERWFEPYEDKLKEAEEF